MLIPYDWLKEFVDVPVSPEELAHALTMFGFEVEGIEQVQGSAVLDVAVTSNRGDCLSVLGIAREVAALFDQPLRQPALSLEEQGPPAAELADVAILKPRLCPRYSARVIIGVQVRPSPEWAAARLVQCGLRPINAVVDATNLVLLEMGQPLHAFDMDAIARDNGRAKIIVRTARANERLTTLDGVTRSLSAGMLVIADPGRPVALAGIMGGADTEVTYSTKNVLLESAHFDRVSIRRTCKALGMSTEASYRFERIVDPGGTVRALDRVARLIVQFCGGRVAQGVIDVYPRPVQEARISLRPSRANRLLGTNIPAAEIASMLRRLGLQVTESRRILVVVPTHRADLKTETDLTEEIARLYGYDNIPATVPPSTLRGRQSPRLEIEEKARSTLLALGLDETMNHSLDHPSVFDRLNLPPDHPLRNAIAVKNPKSEDFTILRTTLLGHLLATLRTNCAAGIADVHAFEIGRVFLPDPGGGLPEERDTIGVVLSGKPWTSAWNIQAEADFYTLKGIAEQLVAEFARQQGQFSPVQHPAFRTGRTASLSLAGEEIGILGEAAPQVLANYDLTQPAYLLEVNLAALARHSAGAPQFTRVSRFPAVRRDLAVVVAEDLPAERVASVIRESGGALLESVALFDLYRGDQIPQGRKSLAYSLIFRHHERTLTDEEVDSAMKAIRQAIAERLSGRMR